MTVVDPVEGKLDIRFVSQFEGSVDINVIRISAPIHEAKIYPVRVNSQIEAYLFCNASQIFRVYGTVIDRLIINDMPMLDIRVLDKPERIQRRQYYRFDCIVPVIYFESKSDIEGEACEIIGQTIDLSGGGISAYSDKKLSPGTVISGTLYLDDYELKFEGKVIRSKKEIINEKIKYYSSISFIEIGFREREKIVSFIFNKQRELLSKGLRSG